MSISIICVILCSALLHSTWNLLAKKHTATLGMYAVGLLLSSLILSPLFLIDTSLSLRVWEIAWRLLLSSCTCLSFYYIFLVLAYQRGDLSVMYPFIRSSPLIVVTVVTFCMPEISAVSFEAVTGIMLIVAGCFLLPIKNLRSIEVGAYFNLNSLIAFIAACGTAGYSILDSMAIGDLKAELGSVAPYQYSCIYGLFQFTIAGVFLCLMSLLRDHRSFVSSLKSQKRIALPIGLATQITYFFILYAMNAVENVSYVVALRQASIMITLLAGILLLGEKAHLTKIVGALACTSGLVIVALF